jgi:hypothetical protein
LGNHPPLSTGFLAEGKSNIIVDNVIIRGKDIGVHTADGATFSGKSIVIDSEKNIEIPAPSPEYASLTNAEVHARIEELISEMEGESKIFDESTTMTYDRSLSCDQKIELRRKIDADQDLRFQKIYQSELIMIISTAINRSGRRELGINDIQGIDIVKRGMLVGYEPYLSVATLLKTLNGRFPAQ